MLNKERIAWGLEPGSRETKEVTEKVPSQDPTRLPASKDLAFFMTCHLGLDLGV